jgi:hypothetical protein
MNGPPGGSGWDERGRSLGGVERGLWGGAGESRKPSHNAMRLWHDWAPVTPLMPPSARHERGTHDRATRPFLRRRTRKWKFRSVKGGTSIKSSHRLITYAGRRDSVIFRHYRDILSDHLEEVLRVRGLSDCVIAYRSIESPGGHSKSNVDFAIEAFGAIREAGDCTVFCLDIKSFFDNILHENIEATWKLLLGVDRLPDHHFKVMKATTQYSFIEEKVALGILGFFGEKKLPNGALVRGYLVPRRSLPTRLCSLSQFRRQIAKNVSVNRIGIPQGLPISDVLANAVLLDFDLEMKEQCDVIGGLYRRYCDDLLFVVPGKSVNPDEWIKTVEAKLGLVGGKLKLGHEKSAVHSVACLPDGKQKLIPIATYKQLPTIDYLGLSYDGTSVYLRQSTLSRLKGRIVLPLGRDHERIWSDRGFTS